MRRPTAGSQLEPELAALRLSAREKSVTVAYLTKYAI